MKIIAFASRADEMKHFERVKKEFGVEIDHVYEPLSLDTVEQAKGYDSVLILACDASRPVVEKLHEYGCKAISTRSRGYNSIDLDACKEYGIKASNITYSPNSVAEFAVMLILASNRNLVPAHTRQLSQDYTLAGLCGRELRNQTVGVLGVGKIGSTVVKNLSGFGCKILGCDLVEKEEMKQYLTYMSLAEMVQQCDVLTIHIPYYEENHHIINKELLKSMKDGAVLINTARGELINTEDLIEAIESEKLSKVALDVLEDETGIFFNNHNVRGVKNHNLSILKAKPNVIVTNHMAFYTEQAVYDMVSNGVKSLCQFHETGTSEFEIVEG